MRHNAPTRFQSNRRSWTKPALLITLVFTASCVNESIDTDNQRLIGYQQALAVQGPQIRHDTEGLNPDTPLGLLEPIDPSLDPNALVETNRLTDFNTPVISAEKTIKLDLNEAITKALANSPEIRVISYDPAIAEQELIQSTADFDPTLFGRANYAYDDKPTSSLSEIGESERRLFESGIKQRSTYGAEWSASYLLTRNWDDLPSRNPETRYEPVLAFQVRQPLLRDYGEETTLAGVNIAKLNHMIALMTFRQRAEELAAGVISAYWRLGQGREELKIHQEWLEMAKQTLTKVEGREGIDATDVQIKQAQSRVWQREAALLQAKREVMDAQDTLVRLMADPEVNLMSNPEVELVTAPAREHSNFDRDDILTLAMKYNPRLRQARLGVDIADINIKVAKNQRMPKLDLVAGAGTQTLEDDFYNAHDRFRDGDHYNFTLGLNVEYPLRNRSRQAEYTRRLIERRKAVTTVQNLADQIAEQARINLRQVETSFREIDVNKKGMEASLIHMEALEETEEIREKLTPEYLLVKLQAQDSYSAARRDHMRAIMEYNAALARLKQVTGTLLNLHTITPATP